MSREGPHPSHFAAVAVPSFWGILPLNTTVSPLLPRCPHMDHRKGQLGKEPQTVCGNMAPRLPDSKADLEGAC